MSIANVQGYFLDAILTETAYYEQMYLRRRAIPTVFTNPFRVIDLSAIEDCNVVIATVVVPL